MPQTRGIGFTILLSLWLNGCVATQSPLVNLSAANARAAQAMARGDYAAAQAGFLEAIKQDPSSMQAALARDGLQQLTGPIVYSENVVTCSDGAISALNAAEERFMSGRTREALPYYQEAVAQCPDNATIWINAGDAFFTLGEYARARDLFLQGLVRDPWQRSGHRFLADTEAQLGNAEAAYNHAMLAVISDPTYQAGWFYFQSTATALGGQWNRAFAAKPTASIEDEKPVVHLSPDPGSESSYAHAQTLWVAYGILRAVEAMHSAGMSPPPDQIEGRWPPDGWEQLSPLAREERRVDEILVMRRNMIREQPDNDTIFWRSLENARTAGFLREAIFLNMMDQSLAPEYAQYRSEKRDRLIEYVRTLVAPLPQGSGRVTQPS